MKRKIQRQNLSYSIEEEPIVISKATLDILLKQENPGDLIALYTFYYYTAKWQKTNRPKSTTYYTAKGLNWSEDRVRKRKNILKQLKLIEDIETRGEGNRITGHYIHVKFIWDKQNFHTPDFPECGDIHPPGFPECGNSQSVENHKGNALNTNNTNALKTNSLNALRTINKEEKNTSLDDSSNHLDDLKDHLNNSKNHLEEAKKIIQFWNTLPKTISHKKEDTKVFQLSVEIIRNLLQGLPIQHKKDLTPVKLLENFAQENKIPSALLVKKWDYEEIKTILKKLHDDELDENRKYSLPSIFFNKFSGKNGNTAFSWFLYVANGIKVADKYSQIVEKLAIAINITLLNKTKIKWAKDFEKFIGENGKKLDRVNKVLDWYKDNFKNQYIPKAFSVLEFIEKFPRLENAIERDKNKNNFQASGFKGKKVIKYKQPERIN
ncbi:MAG: hypothetical protein ACTSRZ_20975 [Promethearchaeota archaeon]